MEILRPVPSFISEARRLPRVQNKRLFTDNVSTVPEAKADVSVVEIVGRDKPSGSRSLCSAFELFDVPVETFELTKKSALGIAVRMPTESNLSSAAIRLFPVSLIAFKYSRSNITGNADQIEVFHLSFRDKRFGKIRDRVNWICRKPSNFAIFQHVSFAAFGTFGFGVSSTQGGDRIRSPDRHCEQDSRRQPRMATRFFLTTTPAPTNAKAPISLPQTIVALAPIKPAGPTRVSMIRRDD